MRQPPQQGGNKMLTRFGSKIKMVSPPDIEGWAKFEYVEEDRSYLLPGDRQVHEWHVSDIRTETQEELDLLLVPVVKT